MSPLLTPTQNTEAATTPTQNVAVQKMPFHQPQIGPLRHILGETGQGGNATEYDSYSDHRS